MKSKKAMIEFLTGHFRYSTMNRWNGSSSYAANVKLHGIRFPSKEVKNRAYDMLETEEAYDGVNQVLEEFARAHDWRYQIGFNGRSSGYLVLYQGGRKVSDHKSYCTSCYQRNFTAATETDKTCGACHKPARVNQVFYQTFTTGESLGASAEEMADWSTDELRAEYKLVREFDAAVKVAIAEFIYTAENNTVEDETYTVQKTRKVLTARE